MFIRTTILATLLLASPALAEEIACTDAFAIDSSEQRLIDIYGAENVETGTVPGPEGTEMLATRVFPGDPQRQLEFVWWDEENLAEPSFIDLGTKLVGPGGVHVGMRLDELEAVNEGPFSLYGFGWDYGGSAGFETGPLSELEGNCRINVRLAPRIYPDGLDLSSVMGDRQISSDDPLLDQIDVRVDSVSIGYAHPDFRD
jgi:hypothetical protein